MIRNYLKISYRNLIKSKGYAAINIFGLAIGMACCLVILAIVYTELNYDRHHERADRIYRLAETFWEDGKIVESSASIGIPVGPVVSAAFPGVKTVRFYKTFEKIPLLRYEDKRFYEEALLFTDSTVFDIFTFPFLRGNQATALAAPFSIVLTEDMARKYFGTENPLGKTLKFENQLDFTVTGVMENLPPTSHIQFDFLASFQNLEALFKASGTSFSWDGWYWNPCHTYLLLPPDLPAERLAAQLPEFTKTHAPEWLRSKLEFFLQPLTDIHLHSNLYQELQVNGSEQSVWMFTLIALFVLLIACINFMNLSTARSAQRAKEIAVRKTIGAGRSQLVWQFLGESLLLSFIAAAGAYFLATLSLPLFRETLGITLDLNLIGTTKVLGSLAVLAVLAGLLAGIYPALFLSAYKPVEGLNMTGAGPVKSRSALLRKSLVVFQFCISIALLTGMLVIQRQHRFLQEKELGFDKEQLVLIPIRGTDIKQQNRIDAFKQRLTREPDVLHACALSNIVGRDVQVCPFQVEGLKDVQQIPGMFVDFDFMATFGVELKAGRAFDPTHPTDTFAFLLNEATLGQFGWQEAEGKRIKFGPEGQVIGVLEDFNFSKLQERIRPLAITIRPSWYSYVAVRLAPGDVPGTLGRLKNIWQEFEPERPFDAFFLDDNLNQLYEKEARLGWVFAVFSVLAIIIGCLGLFGLATFAAERRVKEIGIRRVLGATVSGIVGLLSKDFLQLVLLAFLLAAPLAWYGLSRWLQDFPYRIELEWWFFGLAGFAAVVVAFLTVGVQSARAALADPVESLRSE